MNNQKVKAVVFDLDGTLLDTLADIGTGANFALCQCGFPTYPIEDYRQRIGNGIKVLLRSAMPETATEEDLEQVNGIYQTYYPEHCCVHTTYFPGVMDCLKALEQAGLRLAVLSNKTERTTLKIMEHYFPNVHWEFVWGNNGVRPLKPKLDAGKLACEALQLKPEEIVYVGDGDGDMEFASRMGFVAAGVTWGNRSAQQLRDAGADFLSDTFEELLKQLPIEKV